MLQARVSKGRGHPFICASCRHKLSTTARQHPRKRCFSVRAGSPKLARPSQPLVRPVPPDCTARHLSTTALLCDSAANGSAPRARAFPGTFAGRPAGSWDLPASGTNRPATGSLAANGLLPHEREARQQTPAVSPPPALVTPAAAKPEHLRTNGPSNKSKKAGLRGDLDQTKANLSRSVLANVFNTSREPRPPPARVAWSTGSEASTQGKERARNTYVDERVNAVALDHPPRVPGVEDNVAKGISVEEQKPARSDPPARPSDNSPTGAGRTGLAQASAAPLGPGKGRLSDPQATLAKQPRLTPTGKGAGVQDFAWGSFSRRKAQTIEPWAESTTLPSNRPKVAPASGREPVASKPEANTAVVDTDFWGELETRVTGFQDRRQAAAAAAVRALPKPVINRPASSQHTQARQSNNTKSGAEEQPPVKRRKSRFEMMEEEENFRNRRSLKLKKSQKSRRAREDDDDDVDEESVYRWEERQRLKAERKAGMLQPPEEEQQPTPIFLPEYISAANLAKALEQRPSRFLEDMEKMGLENVTPDTILTGEIAALIAMEFGYEPTVDTGSQRDLKPRPPPEDVSSLSQRPPVITIMGHVDHGKTTLLDWLRKSSVAAQEHGGITQHIGAFVVKMSSGKFITFLDTPGHAAFLAMRQRGANVTDIVVLVVAADDSVMPQTIEALKHARAAKVPIIVAINKIDKEDARVDQVKADISRHGVQIEDYGGDVQVVCVSGKTGQGMSDLEENIITLSEVLDVRAEADGLAEGWVLESSVKIHGKTATVLVKRGTLKPGDILVAGKTWARVRVLRNEAGAELDEASPGTPVEIVGWRDLPESGEQVLQAPDEGKAKMAVEYRLEMAEREANSIQLAEKEQRQRDKAVADEAAKEAKEAAEAAARHGAHVPPVSQEPAEPGIIYQNFTIKADVVGSIEAICGSVLELGNHEVRPRILRSSAGQVSESDVDHAAASNSVIINFSQPILPHIKHRAEGSKVKILDHSVIYNVVDDAKARLSELLPMSVSHRVCGEADVLQIFTINVKKRVQRNIAGCRVRNGAIKKPSRVKVLRQGEVVFDGHVDTLRHVKKDVMEMGKGTECGIGLEKFDDFHVNDQIQTYEEIREKRYLE